MHRAKGSLIQLSALILGIAVGFASYLAFAPAAEAVNPPDVAQQNTDIYQVLPSWPAPTLAVLNPITVSLKAGGRTVRYAYQVVAGCSDGNMRQTLAEAMASTTDVTGITFVESSTPQLTIRANCGVDFVNKCGGGAVIACLGRGWPYVDDIDAVTTMATFYDLSQVAIWEHELAGHALATWNEQYKLDGSFGPTPGLVDFMNTGPDSRHDWPQASRDRWERTMWTFTDCTPQGPNADGLWWYPCEGRFYNQALWSFDPATGIWYNPAGAAEWGQCVARDHDCYDLRLGVWIFKTGPPFDPALGFLNPPVQ